MTAMINGYEAVKDLAHASSLCGACEDVCPVKIQIPRMLVALREHLDREKIAPWRERAIFKALAWILIHPAIYRLSGALGRMVQQPFVRDGRLTRLPLFFRRWTDTRDLIPLAPKTFMDQWNALEREERK